MIQYNISNDIDLFLKEWVFLKKNVLSKINLKAMLS